MMIQLIGDFSACRPSLCPTPSAALVSCWEAVQQPLATADCQRRNLWVSRSLAGSPGAS